MHGRIIIDPDGSGFTSFPKDDALAGAGAATATVPRPAASAHPGVESNGRTGTPTKPPAGRVGGHRDDPGGEGKPGNGRSRGGRSARPCRATGGREFRSGHGKKQHCTGG